MSEFPGLPPLGKVVHPSRISKKEEPDKLNKINDVALEKIDSLSKIEVLKKVALAPVRLTRQFINFIASLIRNVKDIGKYKKAIPVKLVQPEVTEPEVKEPEKPDYRKYADEEFKLRLKMLKEQAEERRKGIYKKPSEEAEEKLLPEGKQEISPPKELPKKAEEKPPAEEKQEISPPKEPPKKAKEKPAPSITILPSSAPKSANPYTSIKEEKKEFKTFEGTSGEIILLTPNDAPRNKRVKWANMETLYEVFQDRREDQLKFTSRVLNIPSGQTMLLRSGNSIIIKNGGILLFEDEKGNKHYLYGTKDFFDHVNIDELVKIWPRYEGEEFRKFSKHVNNYIMKNHPGYEENYRFLVL